jgi:hypothetical protein
MYAYKFSLKEWTGYLFYNLFIYLCFFVTMTIIQSIEWEYVLSIVFSQRVIFTHHVLAVEFVISNESIIFCIVGK